MRYEELTIEGRNAVLEAFRSGKTIDKVFVLEGCQDGPIKTILREAKKHGTMVKFVSKDRLDNMSETKKHQGVIAYAAAYNYATVEDILAKAEEAVYKRGRNAKSPTMAKNASMSDYRRATGFEALMGYLYLAERFDRILELTVLGLDGLEKEEKLYQHH